MVSLPRPVILTFLAALLANGAVLAEGTTQTLTELFFGMSSASGRSVSEQDWQIYVNEVLAAKLPGFTIVDCIGYAAEPDKPIMREGCKQVIILAEPRNNPGITEAVTEYKHRFGQKSVLRIEHSCQSGSCRFE